MAVVVDPPVALWRVILSAILVWLAHQLRSLATLLYPNTKETCLQVVTSIIFSLVALIYRLAARVIYAEAMDDHFPIPTAASLRGLIVAQSVPFEGVENEDNWERRKVAIANLRAMLNDSGPRRFPAEFKAGINDVMHGILKAASSLRTSLAMDGLELLQELSKKLDHDTDHFLNQTTPSLMKICSGSKALTSKAAQSTLNQIFMHQAFTSRLTTIITDVSTDKNPKLRVCALSLVQSVIKSQQKSTLERHNAVDTLEKTITSGLTDGHNDVRVRAREVYWTFQPKWLSRAEK